MLSSLQSAGLKHIHLYQVHNSVIGCYEKKRERIVLNLRYLKRRARDNAVEENESERQRVREALYRSVNRNPGADSSQKMYWLRFRCVRITKTCAHTKRK